GVRIGHKGQTLTSGQSVYAGIRFILGHPTPSSFLLSLGDQIILCDLSTRQLSTTKENNPFRLWQSCRSEIECTNKTTVAGRSGDQMSARETFRTNDYT
ncbi:MAG: hypothetical protein QOG92_1524, partial [Verrucomicrobiota bacterium]|nr:hypothetical protein [Verrucomicrobiota bacterium]